VRRAAAPPTPGNRNKYLRSLSHELLLHLLCEHQVAVAQLHGRERREDPPADAEVHSSHMRAFLRALHAQRDPPKILCDFLILWFAIPAASQIAIVTIWASNGLNSQSLGTGFFVSEDGRILTCYHVVVGAREIEVFNDQIGHSKQVVVEAIAPEHDLAFLRVTDLRQRVKFLRFADSSVNPFDEQLYIFGHAAGIVNQRLAARLTRKSFVRSAEIREHGKPLMNYEDVDLLTLQTDAYRGISGGPVMSHEGVVGVIFGGFNTGGGIMWAIPVKYARIDLMVAVNKEPRTIGSWNTLSNRRFLLAAGTTALRQVVPINDRLSTALDEYFRGIESLEQNLTGMSVPNAQAAQTLHALRQILLSMPAKQLHRNLDRMDVPIAAQAVMERFPNDIKQAEEADKAATTATYLVAQQQLNVFQELRAFQEGLPDTKRNSELFDSFAEDMKTRQQEFQKEYGDFDASLQSKKDEFMQELAHMRTGEDLLNAATAAENFFAVMADPETLVKYSYAVALAKEVGLAVQRLSYSDFDF